MAIDKMILIKPKLPFEFNGGGVFYSLKAGVEQPFPEKLLGDLKKQVDVVVINKKSQQDKIEEK